MDYVENEIRSNPYRLKSWLNYLSCLDESSAFERYKIYERAVQYLPRSYKLWYTYLDERERNLRAFPISDKGYECLVQSFERALVHLHKMPKLWQKYCQTLMKLSKGTATRKAFDRALQSLPITQHQGIWDLYIQWIKEFGCPETSVRVFRRYLMFDPSQREIFINYLDSVGMYQEEAKQLALCVDDAHYISPLGSNKHQLWMKLCDLCASHGDVVSKELNVEPIIKSGIMKFSDEVGRLWGRLADYYVQQGLFDKARDVYEEALNGVVTVKDFTIVFDKYTKVEEQVLTAKLQWLEELENLDMKKAPLEDIKEKLELEKEVEIRLARIEHMLNRRPLLLNSVVLRQNPHNVYEWLKRIKILRQQSPAAVTTAATSSNNPSVLVGSSSSSSIGNRDSSELETTDNSGAIPNIEDEIQRELIAQTYAEAVKTINSQFAVGKLSHVWIAFAKFYERQSDLNSARSIYKRATQVDYKSVEELANVWCAWAEMEMRHEEYNKALLVLQKAVSDPPKSLLIKKENGVNNAAVGMTSNGNGNQIQESATTSSSSSSSSHRTASSLLVFKHVKVWSLYLDLEEGVGTVDTCRAAYERAIDLKVATPQIMLNYASYLEERNYFDDSFRVYEKAVTMFVYPQLRIIWLTYIDKFIARYGGTKIERLRDMFENAVANVPEENAPEFYIKYAKAEEDLGLTRQAISIYERASRAVGSNDRLNMYRLYAKKMEQFYGVTKTRPVYERAIQELSDDDSREICIEFAEMETKLGEVDRARALYQYGSQFAPPQREPVHQYWSKWKEFEEAHGNEDSYREMLRIKRSVETANSQVPVYLSTKRTAADSNMVDFQPEQKRQTITTAPSM